ncbi:TPA: AAA family ATPase [Morganella morganii]|nr:AAA family ATPase [Morganella morganii]
MKIKKIDIKDIGGIKRVTIEFDGFMNIICGPNGIGKTTILDSVAHGFILQHSQVLKRHAQSSDGHIKAKLKDGDIIKESEISFKNFYPEDNTYINGFGDAGRKVIYFNISRMFKYEPLRHISNDGGRESHNIYSLLMNGISVADMKNWFANRCLFINTPDALSENNKINLELAKKCFSLLNAEYGFSRVDAKKFDVFVSTPNGEIWYEYLSAGFKSCLSILFGIIKEIEMRMPDDDCLAQKFDGIVLIDELEMHLHPEWQSKIVSILRNTFPATQFIVTTHSPHIIQNAEPNQIIALGIDSNGYTCVRELPNNEFGYAGWTLDEVLKDVMGMEDTRSQKLKNMLSEFDKALDEENRVEAERIYKELDMALHPENVLRKMLSIDLSSISEEVDN